MGPLPQAVEPIPSAFDKTDSLILEIGEPTDGISWPYHQSPVLGLLHQAGKAKNIQNLALRFLQYLIEIFLRFCENRFRLRHGILDLFHHLFYRLGIQGCFVSFEGEGYDAIDSLNQLMDLFEGNRKLL